MWEGREEAERAVLVPAATLAGSQATALLSVAAAGALSLLLGLVLAMATGRRVTTREAIALLDAHPELARINAHLRHKGANLRSVALDTGIGKTV